MARQAGEVLHFDNGGRIVIHDVRDGWIYYARFMPDAMEADLFRRTEADFEHAVMVTKQDTALDG